MDRLYVHVYSLILVHHPHVALNVLSVLNAHSIKLALIRNVQTHVRADAEQMQNVGLTTIVQFALAYPDILEMRSQYAQKFLVSLILPYPQLLQN